MKSQFIIKKKNDLKLVLLLKNNKRVIFIQIVRAYKTNLKLVAVQVSRFILICHIRHVLFLY